MIGFLGRRLAAVGLQVVLVTFIAYALFFVVSAATGATPEQRVAGKTATPEQVARVAEILGTDRPVYEQYLRFLGGVAHRRKRRGMWRAVRNQGGAPGGTRQSGGRCDR